GTIVKTSGDNKGISVPVWNKTTGIVKADTGTLTLSTGSGGNVASGTFAGGVHLSGTYTLGDATFTGVGNAIYDTVTFAGRTTTVTAPGSTTTLSATATGPGKLIVRGTLDWVGGDMKGGGTTYVSENARLNLVNQSCCSNRSLGSNHTIVNDGTMSIGTGEGFNFGDAFEVYNHGRLEWSPTTYSDLNGSSALIANAGTFVKQGTYNGPVSIPVENDGTIEVEAGILSLNERFRSFARTRNVLKEGEYVLKGTLRISNLNVVRNAARITLDGTAAALTDTVANNALRNLAFNAGGGRLTLKNGATLTAVGLVRNAGKVAVEAGSTLMTSGYTQSRGATVLDAPTSTLAVGTAPGMTLDAGSVRGSGVIQGNVANAGGIVMPGGAAPGQLTIQGNFTQSAGGSMNLDVAGTSSHDSLSVSGTAALDGRLALLSSAAYVPVMGDTFNLLTYASRTGAFASLSGTALPGGLTYSVQLQPQSTKAVVQ
ncbi:MAG: hypothetical protein M3134_10745, partial [Actinomycetota bacterium]|nr:hypothetical protein [Actinomycetota bacterium]